MGFIEAQLFLAMPSCTRFNYICERTPLEHSLSLSLSMKGCETFVMDDPWPRIVRRTWRLPRLAMDPWVF